MPLNIDLLQILLHILNFVILAGGLTFLLYRPANRFLEERKKYFEELSRESELAKEKADAVVSDYEERMQKLQQEIENMRYKAESEMAATSKAYIDKAKERAGSIISAAEKEAEERKEHILDSAQTEIGELVVTATQKLLSDTVTDERNSALYDEFIRLAEETVASKRTKK